MNEFSIIANCTCKTPSNESPAMHSGTCKVWALHHNLGDEKPVEVLHTFETCIHVGLWHPSADLDKKSVDARITKAARQWARHHGYTTPVKVSAGWTLGPEQSQTRLIFSVRKPEGAALESLRRAREI
ncbi:hypothetical protein SEA_MARKY_83 [Streptomyces phage Marky]|nr:hypothetical protein SEA_MARKY_83 [Streptomyces phage Marky]